MVDRFKSEDSILRVENGFDYTLVKFRKAIELMNQHSVEFNSSRADDFLELLDSIRLSNMTEDFLTELLDGLESVTRFLQSELDDRGL